MLPRFPEQACWARSCWSFRCRKPRVRGRARAHPTQYIVTTCFNF